MECETCTLCCTLCEVKDIDKPAGVRCKYITEHCSIYKERPQGCRDFNCAYIQMNKVNIAMRPDNCGVVFEKMSDTEVLGMLDPDKSEHPHAQRQIELFKQSGYNVIITLDGKVTWQ